MKCTLVKVARQIKRKDGSEITIYDLFLVFENGTKEKILPNEYSIKDDKNIEHSFSNRAVLLALATDTLPF